MFKFAKLFFLVAIRVVVRVAVRDVVLNWEMQIVRVKKGPVNGSKCYPLFSWDSIVRCVRIGYSDVLLTGSVPDVEGRVSVQTDPDCEVRCVTRLGPLCVTTFHSVPFLPGDWMLGEKT